MRLSELIEQLEQLRDDLRAEVPLDITKTGDVSDEDITDPVVLISTQPHYPINVSAAAVHLRTGRERADEPRIPRPFIVIAGTTCPHNVNPYGESRDFDIDNSEDVTRYIEEVQDVVAELTCDEDKDDDG